MGHADANHIFEKIQESLTVDKQKVLQISMDGPNVNKKVLRLLQEDLQVTIFSPLETLLGFTILLTNVKKKISCW